LTQVFLAMVIRLMILKHLKRRPHQPISKILQQLTLINPNQTLHQRMTEVSKMIAAEMKMTERLGTTKTQGKMIHNQERDLKERRF